MTIESEDDALGGGRSRSGWTLIGAQGNLSAQHEHTMIITKGEPIIGIQH